MDLKTVFVIAITTSRMIMPGMPEMPKMPEGMKLPPGFKMPGMIGAPKRELTMDLWSDKGVDASSKAECAIPNGLELGPKVNLKIDLPEKVRPGSLTPPTKPGKMETPKFVMKFYWQCAEVVPTGQPKTLDMDKMMGATNAKDARGRVDMQKAMKMMASAHADQSHAYWPYEGEPISEESQHCPGLYKLTTNYCGATDVTLDPGQDFLAALELTSPGEKIDLAQTIKVEWKPVPNALAYILTAMGSGENEMVTWTSANDPEVRADFVDKLMTPAEVQKYVEKGILLPPDKTSCRIPAGIFKDCRSPMLTVVAVGADKKQSKDGIETQVTVRSKANMMLGGMAPGMMPGMGGESPPSEGTE